MAESLSDGVVDRDCLLWGTANLYVAGQCFRREPVPTRPSRRCLRTGWSITSPNDAGGGRRIVRGGGLVGAAFGVGGGRLLRAWVAAGSSRGRPSLPLPEIECMNSRFPFPNDRPMVDSRFGP
jgi:hypothetical protein